MKKFLTILTVVCLLITGTYAYAANSPYTYNGTANFVVSKENHLVGVKDATEIFNYLPVYASNKAIITGVVEGNIVREKGLAQFYTINDVVIGLTTLNVSINLDRRYFELTKDIVIKNTGAEELNTENIITATYYVNNDHIGHIFFDNATEVLPVGVVYFKGKIAILFAGDCNNDGVLELGFHASQPVYEVDSSEKIYR